MALPQYTYDPTSQQYALVGQPAASESGGFGGFFAGIGDLLQHIFNKNQTSAPKFNYDPASQQYTRLASGGQVMNSGLAAARYAQNQGRGQDTMLVHMTPAEVGGLQTLAMRHGGSLTINPKTGLPEAGFLSNLLPAILGAGLTFFSGGALSPLMAAGLVGGATGLATGSLGKGLMAGLGAFGGAGLGAGLAGAGATTASGMAADEVAKQAVGNQLAEEAAKNAAVEGFTLPPDYAQLAGNTATAEQIAAQRGLEGNLAMAGRGLEGITTEAGRKAFMAAAPSGTLPIAGMTLASAMAPKRPDLASVKRKSYIRPQELEVRNMSREVSPLTFADSSERQMLGYGYSPQPIYAAAQGGVVDPDYNMETGGIAGFSDGYAAGGETGLEALAKKRKSLKGDSLYKFAQDRRDSSMEASIDQNFAAGGLPPRFLSGGGDGMSDSIKANIDGKQEARLADGEFVVPADVVSHLGNGSSKAGAKKLYGMMDKIRKARTGKTRQAPQVNATKYMPA